jgi:hypothetical protein
VGAAVLVVAAVAGDPVAGAGAAVLPTGAPVSDLLGLPTSATPAPALAGAGALVLAGAGLLVLSREPRLPRFGARYASGRRSGAAQDPDRRAWDDLDEGRDPTVGAHPAPGSGRGDDP